MSERFETDEPMNRASSAPSNAEYYREQGEYHREHGKAARRTHAVGRPQAESDSARPPDENSPGVDAELMRLDVALGSAADRLNLLQDRMHSFLVPDTPHSDQEAGSLCKAYFTSPTTERVASAVRRVVALEQTILGLIARVDA